jgi:hypothetical protein
MSGDGFEIFEMMLPKVNLKPELSIPEQEGVCSHVRSRCMSQGASTCIWSWLTHATVQTENMRKLLITLDITILTYERRAVRRPTDIKLS